MQSTIPAPYAAPAPVLRLAREILYRMKDSLQNRGLGAKVEQMPTLKCIDCFVWHQPHKCSLKVEGFGRTPLHPYDRIEGRRHCRRRLALQERRGVAEFELHSLRFLVARSFVRNLLKRQSTDRQAANEPASAFCLPHRRSRHRCQMPLRLSKHPETKPEALQSRPSSSNRSFPSSAIKRGRPAVICTAARARSIRPLYKQVRPSHVHPAPKENRNRSNPRAKSVA